jgi:hypothetical protein
MSENQKENQSKEASETKPLPKHLKLQSKGVRKKKRETWSDRIPGYEKMVQY